jgi:hypothetical protein
MVPVDLDDERSLDPAVAGAKGAWLARGRQAGLPVLPGVVVPAEASLGHMACGVQALSRRGSGGARLEVAALALDPRLAEAVRARSLALGDRLVVRSSSILEASGAWSGAFTSYVDILPAEIEVAVRGCWAAAFSVAAIRRHEAAGIEPGSAPMAIVIQPSLGPDFGGTARTSGEDVIVVSVAGSPAPLVQGWEPGVHARVTPAGDVTGDEARALLGDDLARRVAETLLLARDRIGATACEWAAVGDVVTLLQLGRPIETEVEAVVIPEELRTDLAARMARLVRRAPGPMGEWLVLPWAVADLESLPEWGFSVQAPIADAGPALDDAERLARGLAATAWGGDEEGALERAAEALRALRSTRPGDALEAMANLRRPDPEDARRVMALLATVGDGLVAAGAIASPELAWHVPPAEARRILAGGTAPSRLRIGFDRWEPFEAAVVLGTGTTALGEPAAPGIAVGRLWVVTDPASAAGFRPRDVVVATHPVPMLAPLLWDAAAIVTTGGGPAAHLFESARALGIPAVSGIHLDGALGESWRTAAGRFALAIDGSTGTVAATPW